MSPVTNDNRLSILHYELTEETSDATCTDLLMAPIASTVVLRHFLSEVSADTWVAIHLPPSCGGVYVYNVSDCFRSDSADGSEAWTCLAQVVGFYDDLTFEDIIIPTEKKFYQKVDNLCCAYNTVVGLMCSKPHLESKTSSRLLKATRTSFSPDKLPLIPLTDYLEKAVRASDDCSRCVKSGEPGFKVFYASFEGLPSITFAPGNNTIIYRSKHIELFNSASGLFDCISKYPELYDCISSCKYTCCHYGADFFCTECEECIAVESDDYILDTEEDEDTVDDDGENEDEEEEDEEYSLYSDEDEITTTTISSDSDFVIEDGGTTTTTDDDGSDELTTESEYSSCSSNSGDPSTPPAQPTTYDKYLDELAEFNSVNDAAVGAKAAVERYNRRVDLTGEGGGLEGNVICFTSDDDDDDDY